MAQRHYSLMMLAMFIVAIMLKLDGIHATSYTVGGAAGWSLGTDLQAWASQYTFYVGDTLYFPYTYGQSSVLLVTEVAYNDCASDSPLASDGGEGDMAITLTSAQTFYFISGYADQCSQGLRLVVNVLDAPTTNINNNNINNNNNNIPTSPVIFLPPPHTTTYVPNFAHSSSINSIFAPLVVLVMAFVFGFVA